MPELTATQRRDLGRKIREGKERLYPGRGGCGRLAAELGITPQTLSHWMNGNRLPEPGHLAMLAKLFHVSILELCSFPKIKPKRKRPSALDLIMDITETQKLAGESRNKRRKLTQETRLLNSLIKNELGDLLP